MALSLQSLQDRIAVLEMLVDELARTANKTVFAAEPNRAETGRDPSHPRSAAALPQLDPEDERTLAEARRANAEAERAEIEVAAMKRSLADTSGEPIRAYGVSVSNAQQRPGERLIRVGISDQDGRALEVLLSFDLALKVSSSLGAAVADRLLNASAGD